MGLADEFSAGVSHHPWLPHLPEAALQGGGPEICSLLAPQKLGNVAYTWGAGNICLPIHAMPNVGQEPSVPHPGATICL